MAQVNIVQDTMTKAIVTAASATPGDLFELNGGIHMKINLKNCETAFVSLATGNVVELLLDEEVCPLQSDTSLVLRNEP